MHEMWRKPVWPEALLCREEEKGFNVNERK